MLTNYAGISGMLMPKNVDLRRWCETTREDQLGTSTCVANAVANALELLTTRAGQPKDISRLFIYWNARSISGIPGDTAVDNGTKPTYALDSVKQFGVVQESSWPFSYENVTTRPPQALFDNSFGKQLEYKYVYREIPSFTEAGRMFSTIKQAISEGFPVVIVVQQSYDLSSMSGPIGSQQYRSVYEGAPYAGIDHAMLVVGYTPTHLIIENSYGNSTGDNGFISFDMYDSADIVSAHIITSFNGYRFLEERSAAVNNIQGIKDHVNALISQGRYQEVLDGAKMYFIADKQLEFIMGWPTGTIQQFKIDNPSLNWDGFYWDV